MKKFLANHINAGKNKRLLDEVLNILERQNETISESGVDLAQAEEDYHRVESDRQSYGRVAQKLREDLAAAEKRLTAQINRNAKQETRITELIQTIEDLKDE